MKYIDINVSDFEFDELNEAIPEASKYYTAEFNRSNISYTLTISEDNAYELRDLLESYILDENTVKGNYVFDIIRDIHFSIVDEISWLPYCYDYEEYIVEDDE